MSESVAVISPYRRQVEEYETSNYRLRQVSVSDSGEPLTSAAMPTIRTVDNVQGGEWDFVILDLVIIDADRISDIGHISDDHRACVAWTRAKKVFWVVSGHRLTWTFTAWLIFAEVHSSSAFLKSSFYSEKQSYYISNPFLSFLFYLRYQSVPAISVQRFLFFVWHENPPPQLICEAAFVVSDLFLSVTWKSAAVYMRGKLYLSSRIAQEQVKDEESQEV